MNVITLPTSIIGQLRDGSMLNYETRDAILEDQPNNETLMEARLTKLETNVEHMVADIKDIKLGMQEFRRDLQAMNEEMYAGFAAANDATARIELSLCETRMEQKRLSSEQEALKTEQKAMRADLEAMRTDQQAMRMDQQAMRADLEAMRTEQQTMRTEQQAMRTDLEAVRTDQKVLGEKMTSAFVALDKTMEKRITASQNKTILWTIGAMIAIAGLALTIAKHFP